jgi:hypothetical protein
MKKILMIIVFLLGSCGNIFAQAIQDSSYTPPTYFSEIYSGFWVEINAQNINVPNGTLEKQSQYIAKRATEPNNGQTYFDAEFFDRAFVVLEQRDTINKKNAIIESLRNWRECLSFEGRTVIKEDYTRFLIQTEEEYGIDMLNLFFQQSNMILLLLGKVQIQVLKESYGSGKKRIEVPQNSYRMIAMKQPLN